MLGNDFAALWLIGLAHPGNSDRWEITQLSAYFMSPNPSLIEHVDSPIGRGSLLFTGHGISTNAG